MVDPAHDGPLVVYVDTHEAETIIYDGLLAAFGPQRVFRKHLDLGDVEVAGKHGRIILERKKWADLVSSLRPGADGASRYNVQKAQLMAERERAQEEGKSLKVAFPHQLKVVQSPRTTGSRAGCRTTSRGRCSPR